MVGIKLGIYDDEIMDTTFGAAEYFKTGGKEESGLHLADSSFKGSNYGNLEFSVIGDENTLEVE